MNIKRYLLAVGVVFITLFVTEILIHRLVLSSTYKELAHLFRPENDMQEKAKFMPVCNFFFAIFFTYFYVQIQKNRGIKEGVRYGLLMSLFIGFGVLLTQYFVYPLPLKLVLIWIGFGLAQGITCGAFASIIYKPKH